MHGAVSRAAGRCKQSAMIETWRAAWAAVNAPWRNRNFSFTIQQLAAWDAAGPPPSGPGLAPFRYGQGASVTGLANVGMTAAYDLYDAGSPCTSIHPRNKTAMGTRLARQTLALRFPADAPPRQPAPTTSAAATRARSVRVSGLVGTGVVRITVHFSVSTSGRLHLRAAYGANQTTDPLDSVFEVQRTHGAGWQPVPVANVSILAKDPQSLALSMYIGSGSGGRVSTVVGVRMAWSSIPRGLLIYDSVGSPALPFISTCPRPAGTTRLDVVCNLMDPLAWTPEGPS
jgi:hypothetical protein